MSTDSPRSGVSVFNEVSTKSYLVVITNYCVSISSSNFLLQGRTSFIE